MYKNWMKFIKIAIILTLCSALLFSCSNQQKNQSEEKQKAVDKNKTENFKWSYSGKKGPEHWGTLEKEYSICQTGKNQSPINLDSSKATAEAKEVKWNFRPASQSLRQVGPIIEIIPTNTKLKLADSSQVKIGNTTYKWTKTQLHMPSEHTLDGKKMDMEMQWFFTDNKNNISILSVFVKKGSENPAAQGFIQKVSKLTPQKTQKVDAPLSILGLFPMQKQSSLQYTGSLTTPPCSESVQWVVYDEPITFSKKQLNTLRKEIDQTNRPIQNLNDRKISKFTR